MASKAYASPHSPESEMTVLGAMLQSRDAIQTCVSLLSVDSFFRRSHGEIFRTLCEIGEQATEDNLILTIATEALRRRGLLEEIGTSSFLLNLVECVPSAATVTYHANIVQQKAIARRALALGLQLTESASTDNGWREILADLKTLDASVPGGFALQPLDLSTLDSALPPPRWLLEDRVAVGDIALLSGDSGAYKTWFSLQLAIDLSCERSIFGNLSHPGPELSRVLIVDEENSGGLLLRRLGLLARGADLSEEGLTQVYDRVRIFTGSGFRLDDDGAYQTLRRELARFKASVLILDSLVRMHTSDENSAGEMSQLYLTRLAPLRREFTLTILILHHLRKARKDDSHEPGQMLRGSGDLRAMVDSHLQLRKLGPGTASVIADKNRHGVEATPFLFEIADTESGGVAVRFGGEPEQRIGSRDAVKMRIVAFLGREIEAELSTIISAIGRDRKAVTRALETLQNEGIVERPSRGRYRLIRESA